MRFAKPVSIAVAFLRARGPAGSAVEQVRVGHQQPDRKDARPHSARQTACRRRRGDRISAQLARHLLHLLTTGYGTSRTSRDVRPESARWARADIDQVAVTDRDSMSTRPYLFAPCSFSRIEFVAENGEGSYDVPYPDWPEYHVFSDDHFITELLGELSEKGKRGK
jgi:hypothetical protein